MKFYTIGYGGRPPGEFVELLGAPRRSVGRRRADQARPGEHGGLYEGKDRGQGDREAARRTGDLVPADPRAREPLPRARRLAGPYRELLAGSGDLLTARLADLPRPFCLLCAEKRVADCHRQMIADYLVAYRGWEVEHLDFELDDALDRLANEFPVAAELVKLRFFAGMTPSDAAEAIGNPPSDRRPTVGVRRAGSPTRWPADNPKNIGSRGASRARSGHWERQP